MPTIHAMRRTRARATTSGCPRAGSQGRSAAAHAACERSRSRADRTACATTPYGRPAYSGAYARRHRHRDLGGGIALRAASRAARSASACRRAADDAAPGCGAARSGLRRRRPQRASASATLAIAHRRAATRHRARAPRAGAGSRRGSTSDSTCSASDGVLAYASIIARARAPSICPDGELRERCRDAPAGARASRP